MGLGVAASAGAFNRVCALGGCCCAKRLRPARSRQRPVGWGNSKKIAASACCISARCQFGLYQWALITRPLRRRFSPCLQSVPPKPSGLQPPRCRQLCGAASYDRRFTHQAGRAKPSLRECAARSGSSRRAGPAGVPVWPKSPSPVRPPGGAARHRARR